MPSTSTTSLTLVLMLSVAQALKYSSHVSVNTPARSYSHTVRHYVPLESQHGGYSYTGWPKFGAPRGAVRSAGSRVLRPSGVYSSPSNHLRGYPKVRPSIPFFQEDLPRPNVATLSPPWPSNYLAHISEVPLLPASPYHVDSPNPESLWPEGLFVPPIVPLRGFLLDHKNHLDRKDGDISDIANNEINDPYLLEGSEAIQRISEIENHGELFFDDIPHAESLHANQLLRVENNLPPHRLGSIRPSSPFYRFKLN